MPHLIKPFNFISLLLTYTYYSNRIAPHYCQELQLITSSLTWKWSDIDWAESRIDYWVIISSKVCCSCGLSRYFLQDGMVTETRALSLNMWDHKSTCLHDSWHLSPLHHAVGWIVSSGYGCIIFRDLQGLLNEGAAAPCSLIEIRVIEHGGGKCGCEMNESQKTLCTHTDTLRQLAHAFVYRLGLVNACGSIVCGAPSVAWHGIPQTAGLAVRGWSTLTHCLRESRRGTVTWGALRA